MVQDLRKSHGSDSIRLQFRESANPIFTFKKADKG